MGVVDGDERVADGADVLVEGFVRVGLVAVGEEPGGFVRGSDVPLG